MNNDVVVPADLEQTVRRALAEDIGDGDLTAVLIPAATIAHAWVISREAAVLCGRPWFDAVFRELDVTVEIAWRVEEGEGISAGQRLCDLRGSARALLTGERTALNFLQTLSGTATETARHAAALAGTGVKLLDTRKTVPGLRRAQKYAVRCGGGHNHRMGLYDGILIKENHIQSAGSITDAVSAAREVAFGRDIEVEVENLAEVREALEARADILLLDNFSLEEIRDAVALVGGAVRLEVSGGVGFDQLKALAGTGIDFISVGALTKHVRAIDLSMRFEAGCFETGQ